MGEQIKAGDIVSLNSDDAVVMNVASVSAKGIAHVVYTDGKVLQHDDLPVAILRIASSRIKPGVQFYLQNIVPDTTVKRKKTATK